MQPVADTEAGFTSRKYAIGFILNRMNPADMHIDAEIVIFEVASNIEIGQILVGFNVVIVS